MGVDITAGNGDAGERLNSRTTVTEGVRDCEGICSPRVSRYTHLRGYTVGKTLRADRHRHRD